MTKIEKNVLKMLKTGTENRPVKREYICKALGITDKVMRECIQHLRPQNPICNNQDGRGYYMAKTKAQAQRQYRQEKSRALNILRGLKGLNKVAENKTEFEKAINKLLNL